jgi:hypothetical protein
MRYGGGGWAPTEIATCALSARLALTCPENVPVVDDWRRAGKWSPVCKTEEVQ